MCKIKSEEQILFEISKNYADYTILFADSIVLVRNISYSRPSSSVFVEKFDLYWFLITGLYKILAEILRSEGGLFSFVKNRVSVAIFKNSDLEMELRINLKIALLLPHPEERVHIVDLYSYYEIIVIFPSSVRNCMKFK